MDGARHDQGRRAKDGLVDLEYFSILPDPRVDRTRLHKLEDILTITICAVVCNCDTWNEIEDFGEAYKDWFKTFLELPNGIPSHDTFGRVFAALEPEGFERCFQSRVRTITISSRLKRDTDASKPGPDGPANRDGCAKALARGK